MEQPLQIKALREAKGMTQETLSEAAGVSRSLLAQWESGRRRPNTLRLAQVARALRVDPSEMFASRVPGVLVAGLVSDGGWIAAGQGQEAVRRPPQLAGIEVTALRVSDGTMMPTYERGSVLFLSAQDRAFDDAVGHVCSVSAAGLGTSIRLLHRGTEPGRYNLIGLSPTAETEWNVAIERAARVRLCLPPDLVEVI